MVKNILLPNSTVIEQSVLAQLEQDVGIETLAKLLQLFITELITLNSRLDEAITNTDVAQIIDVAHILKNSAALYGATPLALLSKQLHDAESLSVKQYLSSALLIQTSIKKTTGCYQGLANRIGC